MSRRQMWLVALPAALLVSACAPKADAAAELAAINKRNGDFVRWFQNKNADSLAAGYAEDATDLNSNAPPSKGREAIKAAYTQLFGLPGAKLSIRPRTAEVASSGELAWTDGSYALSVNGPDGKPNEDSGNYVVVLKKINGAWLVQEAVGTSEKPLPAPPSPPAKKGK